MRPPPSSHTADEYIALLDTFSGHVVREPAEREHLYREIRRPAGASRRVPVGRPWNTSAVIELTDDFLKTKPGTICHWPAVLDHPVAGTWSITIPLEPFSADDEYEPATFRPGPGGPDLVTTEISLDHILLPATGLEALSERAFTFPVNPEHGYIDGSIYLIAAHCPVDVTRIEFGPAAPDHITATLHAHFDFGAAGGIDIHNRTADLKTTLHFELGHPVSPATP